MPRSCASIRISSPRSSSGRRRPAAARRGRRRITRARVRVAVTPTLDMTSARADLRRVPFLIAAALEGSKRFSPRPAGGERHVASAACAWKRCWRVPAGRALRAPPDVAGWVVSMLIERRGVTYLDVTVHLRHHRQPLSSRAASPWWRPTPPRSSASPGSPAPRIDPIRLGRRPVLSYRRMKAQRVVLARRPRPCGVRM